MNWRNRIVIKCHLGILEWDKDEYILTSEGTLEQSSHMLTHTHTKELWILKNKGPSIILYATLELPRVWGFSNFTAKQSYGCYIKSFKH